MNATANNRSIPQAMQDAERKALAQKTYSVQEMAEELGLSCSYVYAQIAKDNPPAIPIDGKQSHYKQAYLDKLKRLGAKPRRRIVHVLPRVTLGTINPPVQKAETPSQTLPLFGRITQLEQQVEALTKQNSDLIQIKNMLTKMHDALGMD